MNTVLRFVLAVLAVWRVTHLIANESGPWDVFLKLRQLGGPGIIAELLSCFYCLSIWVSLVFVWFIPGGVIERIVTWLALSGAAILLERATGDHVSLNIEDK
ncbi:MAG: DUF1360 domain-containing protein [Bryobacteraceae bacterium]